MMFLCLIKSCKYKSPTASVSRVAADIEDAKVRVARAQVR